jgi:hypothetical protein
VIASAPLSITLNFIPALRRFAQAYDAVGAFLSEGNLIPAFLQRGDYKAAETQTYLKDDKGKKKS